MPRTQRALWALVTLAGLLVAGLLVLGPGRERSGQPAEPSPARDPAPASARANEEERETLERPPPPEREEEARVRGAPAESADPSESRTIRGRVVGAPESLADALEVQASALDTRAPTRVVTCAPDGRFTLTDLHPTTTYHLRTFPAGRSSFGRSRTDVCTARPGPHEVELVWLPERALVFQVADARTGLALSAFEVRLGQAFTRPLLDETGRVRQSFPDGRVRWERWVPEEAHAPVTLVVSARGYRELRLPDVLPPLSGETDLGRLVLEPVPRLVVRVLAQAGEQPIAGALVTLAPEGSPDAAPSNGLFTPHQARTDEAGLVLLSRLPEEAGIVRVRHAGYADAERSLVTSLAEEELITVRLEPR